MSYINFTSVSVWTAIGCLTTEFKTNAAAPWRDVTRRDVTMPYFFLSFSLQFAPLDDRFYHDKTRRMTSYKRCHHGEASSASLSLAATLCIEAAGQAKARRAKNESRRPILSQRSNGQVPPVRL